MRFCLFGVYVQVNPGSLAERAGLRACDAVLQINSRPSDELEHEQAKQEVVASGNNVTFVVQRCDSVSVVCTMNNLREEKYGPDVWNDLQPFAIIKRETHRGTVVENRIYFTLPRGSRLSLLHVTGTGRRKSWNQWMPTPVTYGGGWGIVASIQYIAITMIDLSSRWLYHRCTNDATVTRRR